MSDYSNILGGLNIPSQIPLDVKTYSKDENTLSNLGTGSNLAYSYYKGLVVYCAEEKTSWKWEEVLVGQENTGLLTTDFQYPNGIETFEIDYSNKKYNFFQVETPLISTFVEAGDYITLEGTGTIEDPYVIIGTSSPFNTANNSYFPRSRNESQFGNIGEFCYDFSYAVIGANDDPYGQTGQIGVHPTEQYGALGEISYVFGYNLSAEGFGNFLTGSYNHSGTLSDLSTIFGRNNYNNSPHSLITGAYNQAPFTTFGYKTIFGQGNLVNGIAGLTSGVALLNKSFGTTVLGQANLDYTNTSESVNNSITPLLIIGNGDIATPLDGLWTATSRSNALTLLKNGLLNLPSVTNALITADITGKSVITKEYLESVLPSISDGSETILEAGTNISITGLGTIDLPYIISSNNDDITQYTDTLAQEAVGTILQNSNNIEFSYNPLTPSIIANLSDDYVNNLEYRFSNIETLVNRTSYIYIVGTSEKISPTNFQINSGWYWKINGTVYTNTITQNFTVPLCENGFNRIDLIVLNRQNTAELILGVETTGTAISPTVPTNKLQAFLLNVGDTDFETEIPLLLNQVSQEVRVGITETAPSEQAVIDYVSEQTTILDNSKADRSFITGATKTKITYNNEGVIIAGADANKSDVGLNNVDNTSDLNKPVSIAQSLANDVVLATANAYTDNAITNVYVYKGSVANYAALPNSGQTIGWVWNLIDTGGNYAWTGTVWDLLGATVDISGKEDISNKTSTVIGNESSTSLYLNIVGAVTYFQQKLTDSIFGAFIVGLATKATPIDADSISIVDSADSNKVKKTTFTQLKAFYKTYFDTQYPSGSGTSSGSNSGDNATNTTANTYADTKVDNTVYDATTWDGVTTIAPSKNAVRDKIESVLSAVKVPNTYFINTATGNNVTGVFEDASKPFATIDYVNANFTITDGTIFYLQDTGQTYLINGQLQAKKQSIIADSGSTNILDFSSNVNTYLMVAGGTSNVLSINMPNGTIRCERSGGTGIQFCGGYSGYNLLPDIEVAEIYWNTSTWMITNGGLSARIKVNRKISCRTIILQINNFHQDVIIPEFVCLVNGASYTQSKLIDGGAGVIKINKISGAGSYSFWGPNYIVGDISTTGVSQFYNSAENYIGSFHFNNSIITGGGILLPSSAGIDLVISGRIKSITNLTNATTGTGIIRFINFFADLGTNKITVDGTKTISFENSSIRSTFSPLGVGTTVGTGSFIIKASVFEVVNAVPLMTGGAGGTRTLTIAGLSTNATMLSDQSGTGVTVNVIGKNSVANGIDSKDAVNKGQLDSGYVAKGVDNATTVVLTSATLNSTYPGATTGFRVYCASIIVGAMTYEKTPSGWLGFTCMVP